MQAPRHWNYGSIVPAMTGLLEAFRGKTATLRDLDDARRAEQFKKEATEVVYRLSELISFDGVEYYPLTVNPLGLQEAIDSVAGDVRLLEGASPESRKVLTESKRQLSDFFAHLESVWTTPDESSTRWAFPLQGGDRPGKVIAFPVTLTAPGAEEAERGALFYIRAFLESHPAEWRFEGFANDIREQHLQQLARIAIGFVSDVVPGHVPRREVTRLQRSFTYQTLFGAEVHEGLSHTGAVLVLFTICYLYETLLEEALNLIAAYKPNAVITTEVGPEGQLKPVAGLKRKLDCAVDAWGWDVEFFVAEENEEEAVAVLAARPDCPGNPQGRVHACRHAGDLLKGVLGGLDDARDGWLASLRPASFQVFQPHLPVPRIRRWRDLRAGRAIREDLAQLSDNVFAELVKADGNRAMGHIRLGFSELAFEDTELGERRVVILACAADEADSQQGRLWPTEELSLTTRLADAIAGQLFEADALGSNGTTVFVHLLSDGEPAVRLDALKDAKEIERELLARRRRLKERGRFLRPVVDYWDRALADYDLAELYVLSCEEVPDIQDDVVDGRLPRYSRFAVIDPPDPEGRATWIRHSGLPVVRYWRRGRPDRATIREAFGRPPYHFDRVSVCFSGACPICWDREYGNWKMKLTDQGRYCLYLDAAAATGTGTADLRFEAIQAVNEVDLAMSYHDDSERGNREETVSRIGFRSGSVRDWERPACGHLTEEEKKRLASGTFCLKCSDDPRHLVCRPTDLGRGELVFASMKQAAQVRPSIRKYDAFVVVDAQTGWWCLSNSGCRLPDTDGAVVLCSDERSDEICFVNSRGERRAFQRVDAGLCSLQIGGKSFYAARLT